MKGFIGSQRFREKPASGGKFSFAKGGRVFVEARWRLAANPRFVSFSEALQSVAFLLHLARTIQWRGGSVYLEQFLCSLQ